MSAYDNLRKATQALAQAQSILAAFIGGRDTARPENDGMIQPKNVLVIDNATAETEAALRALRGMRSDIRHRDF